MGGSTSPPPWWGVNHPPGRFPYSPGVGGGGWLTHPGELWGSVQPNPAPGSPTLSLKKSYFLIFVSLLSYRFTLIYIEIRATNPPHVPGRGLRLPINNMLGKNAQCLFKNNTFWQPSILRPMTKVVGRQGQGRQKYMRCHEPDLGRVENSNRSPGHKREKQASFIPGC